MAITNKTVVYAKEVGDVMDLVVGLVDHFKKGKNVAELTDLLDELTAAVSGVTDISSEYKSNNEAVFNAALLGASKVVALFVNKEEEAGA